MVVGLDCARSRRRPPGGRGGGPRHGGRGELVDEAAGWPIRECPGAGGRGSSFPGKGAVDANRSEARCSAAGPAGGGGWQGAAGGGEGRSEGGACAGSRSDRSDRGGRRLGGLVPC